MIRCAFAFILLVAGPMTSIAQYWPSVAEIEVINGENTGYIQVAVDGRDYLKTYGVMKRAPNGGLEKQEMATVWQAGPKDHIIVRASNWSLNSHTVTLLVKYYTDEGTFVGLTRTRQYSTDPAPSTRRFQWLFTKNELIR